MISSLTAPCKAQVGRCKAASVSVKHVRSAKAACRAMNSVNAAAVAAKPTATKKSDYTMSKLELFNGTKRLQTQVFDVADDTVCIRSLDWDRDRFDIEFALEIGTTYNSYLVFGPEKTALIDSSHAKFRHLYLQTLNAELEKMGRTKIDYMLCSHTEPDHSGLVEDLLDLHPEMVVAGSKVSISFLGNLMNREFNSQALKGGQVIDLGGGHELEFVMAPNLHWPDSMFTFDKSTGVMYTCDAFGSHYCTEDPWDTDVQAVLPHYRFYYDCLMKPNARSVTTALRKCKDLEYTTIANGHGPLLRYNMSELVGDYGKWSAAVEKSPTSVAVLYSDNYGYCDRLSQTMAKGITKAGVRTEMVDLSNIDGAELRGILAESNAVVIMCPDSADREVNEALAVVFSELSAKKHTLAVCESFGGRDEPIDVLSQSLVELGMEPVVKLRVKETPTEAVYQQYEEAGTDIAQMLGKKDNIAKLKKMPNSVAKALGKLSSGLYVVTAAHEDVQSAMIASWVAQASFEPLGLTIAVAKDRAIESFMQVGDDFVLNVLGEGRSMPVMKHFLQRFEAGADRFAGVDTVPASNGAPILTSSIAHLELKVVSRMETADHWITYCQVSDGSVSTPEIKTAVHRRKIGNYY